MPIRTYRLLLAELGLSVSLGCTTLPTTPSAPMPPSAGQGDANAPKTAEAIDFSKRKPKVATFIAYGDLHEKAATEPGHSPAEQEELRNKARLAYLQALEIYPNDRSALLALAHLYDSTGNYTEAVATYNRAQQVYPRDAALRYELGMCHARHKNWEPALQSLDKAVQADPGNRRYGVAFGLCLTRAQHYDEGYAVLAKWEGSANAHYNVARMLHHLQQDEASKEHLRKALAENPELVGAQQLLATLEGAVADLGHPVATSVFDSP